MTNHENLINMPIEKFAEFLIEYDDEYGYSCSDGTHFRGHGCFDEPGWYDAVKHEIEWLQSECVVDDKKG